MSFSKYPLRAFTVCVEYVDLLSVTLPWNFHHFEEFYVVTCGEEEREIKKVLEPLCRPEQKCGTYSTNAFYDDGAVFNKWKALEEGLDIFGRHGWICLLDADVLWPKEIHLNLEVGKLYSPLRHMMPLYQPLEQFAHLPHPYTLIGEGDVAPTFQLLPFPPEKEWWHYPTHRNIGEWAGYTQIFHSKDPVLGKAPWHEVNWKHAGGADSFFQQRWRLLDRIRPNWNVLHLGEAGQNWMGRSTPFLSGQTHPEAKNRAKAMEQLWTRRRGQRTPNRYDGEKLP